MKNNVFLNFKTLALFMAILWLNFAATFSFAQSSTCLNALPVSSMDTTDFDTVHFENTSTQFWMSFTAESNYLKITFTTEVDTPAHLHKVYLYSQNCTSPVLVNW